MCTHNIALLLQLARVVCACRQAGWLAACFRRCAFPLRNERFRGRLLRETSLGMRSSGNGGRNPSSEIWQCEILTNFLLFSARVRICFVFFWLVWFFFFGVSFIFVCFVIWWWWAPWMWRKCSVSLLCWFIFSRPWLFVPKEIIRLLQFLFLFFGLLVDDGGWKRLIWKDFFLVFVLSRREGDSPRKEVVQRALIFWICELLCVSYYCLEVIRTFQNKIVVIWMRK